LGKQAVTRYTLAGAWKAEADPQGEWVLFRDVRPAIEKCAELAVERDAYRKALVDIAAIPLTLPSAAAGVARAKEALEK
jgi:hypothetical protein